jgi:D-apionolactonase
MTDDDDVVRARLGGPWRRVQHGRWSLEVRGDEIAEIRYDGVRLLRAIRPVVRDRDWNTVPVVHVAHESTGSTVRTRLRFAADGIDYHGTVHMRLSDDGLAVEFDGRAEVGFERNRIGLVVLHPAADAGRPVRVMHPDGRVTAGAWPTEISPHQPFRDVAGFAWTTGGVAATLTLTGDVFETEDQRNWTDASFKTYSTPLGLPFPVAVPAGGTCRQGARLTVAGRAAAAQTVPSDDVTITSDIAGRLPPISLGACLHPPPDRPPALPTGFETVLVELTGDDRRWPALLDIAAAQAAAIGAALDVRIATADEAAADRAVADMAGRPVARLGVFDPHTHTSTPALWQALLDSIRRHGLHADLVGGTRAHFTELNRQLGALPPELPALSFSVTPQMHATEIPHLVDSLGVHRTVAENALRLAHGRPVFVGPITLARRFNAVATSAAPDPDVDAARAVDPLQPTAFTGAWALGSIAALAPVGVAGLCYFEVCGPRGIVTADGARTAAGRVLSEIAARRGWPVLRCRHPLDVPALALAAGDGTVELFVANLSATARSVRVPGPDAVDLDAWAVRRMTLPAP